MKNVSNVEWREIPFLTFSETRRPWATYAGLCYFFRLSMFSGHAHTLARWQWLHCWEVMPVLTLPIVVSHYFTASGEKKHAQSFCASPGDPIFLLYPMAWEGPMTEVSAQALACMPALQRSSVQGRVTQACLHAAVRKI